MNISIIIPTYKPGSYLKDCLESINNQTMDKKCFEVIIVLNGVIKPYIEYIYSLTKMYDFNSVVIPTETPGVSNARNLGLSRTQGEYVCFIDDDDKISPSYLENLYSKATPNNIVASNVKAFYNNSNKTENDYIASAYKKLINKNSPLSVFKGRKFMSSSCCKIISRRIIQDVRFDTNLKIGEDSVFMAKISKKVKSIVLSDSSAIYYRRLRAGSASRVKQPILKKCNIVCKLLKKYTKMLTPSYNIPFIATRIIATLLKLVRN
ncbi:putative uncharacterized protein [Prevotella sp. CAG:604]|nr:putative uncharacterized protein [Prevotella sp. CAG:604]